MATTISLNKDGKYLRSTRYLGKSGKESKLLFSKIASTRKYCESTQELENALLEALEKVRSYRVSENQLELFDENHSRLLVLRDNLLEQNN
jgi:heat shock protein HslJ